MLPAPVRHVQGQEKKKKIKQVGWEDLGDGDRIDVEICGSGQSAFSARTCTQRSAHTVFIDLVELSDRSGQLVDRLFRCTRLCTLAKEETKTVMGKGVKGRDEGT